MKSVSSGKSNTLLIRFVIKSALATIFFAGVFSLVFSEILIKFDVNLDVIGVLSVIICAVSAFFTSVISVNGFRNNGAVMGIISSLPLVLYSLFNVLFNENTFVLFFIKLAVILLISALGGALIAKKTRSIKV